MISLMSNLTNFWPSLKTGLGLGTLTVVELAVVFGRSAPKMFTRSGSKVDDWPSWTAETTSRLCKEWEVEMAPEHSKIEIEE